GTDSHTMDATVNIGSATLRSNGTNNDPGQIKIDATTNVNAIDKVETQAYGLIGITLGWSEINVNSRSNVNLTGANLRSDAGDVNISNKSDAYGRAIADTTIAVALTGAGGANATVDIDAQNHINLNNASVKGRNVNLYTGRTAGGLINIINADTAATVEAFS